MGAARRARRIAVAILVCACASPATSPNGACLATTARAPLPSVECFESDAGQRYAGLIAAEIGDALMGYTSHPGAADLSVGFAHDASVASVCTGWSVQGDEIAKRLPSATDRLKALPPGPRCFAGRRLEFVWESPEVTSAHVRQATRECRQQITGHQRRNLYCHETYRCPVQEVTERWERADRELRSCVLEKLPLEMHLAGSAEAHPFVPSAGGAPDPDLAIRAMDICEALGDREAMIGCMRQHGWEPRP
jgi:hypothetical protein